MKTKRLGSYSLDILFYIVGCVIYSAAVCLFIAPNQITPGGITGIATVVNYLTDIPSGFTVLILNVPIIILGFVKLGGSLIVKSAVATAILSFTLEMGERFVPPVEVDKILACVFGGILMGLGLSLVMLRGATTGGVDIIAKVINHRFRHLTVGRLMLLLDAAAVIFAMAVYKNIESGLYSVIAIYVSSAVMDTVLYGEDKGKVIYVISAKAKDICDSINKRVKRGVTRLAVKGGYTGNDMEMLMCTVRVHEVSSILKIINGYDKSAFVIVCDAGEILGEGFKNIDSD